MKELKTMTVGELKKLLNEFPDNVKVAFKYPSHDHWHTELVGKIDNADFVEINYTDYHQCFQIVAEEYEGELEEILVLK